MTSKAIKLPLETEPVASDNNSNLGLTFIAPYSTDNPSTSTPPSLAHCLTISELFQTGPGPEGSRGARVVWGGPSGDWLVVTGFGR